MTLTKDDIRILSEPFPEDQLGVKVQSLSRAKDKALLVLYLQHTDVQSRLDQVDPSWSCRVLQETQIGDTISVRMSLTLKGITRENVGEGGDPKSAYSDALKRCAMLFGIGRYLYDSENVWVPYNEQKDKYRSFTFKEYQAALRPNQARVPLGEQSPSQPPKAEGSALASGVPGPVAPAAPTPQRDALNKKLMSLYKPYLTTCPEPPIKEILKARYEVDEARLMTVEQLADLVAFMESAVTKGKKHG